MWRASSRAIRLGQNIRPIDALPRSSGLFIHGSVSLEQVALAPPVEWTLIRPGGRRDHRRAVAFAAASKDGAKRLSASDRDVESMKYGLRLPSYALGKDTATLTVMGEYLRKAEDLGFDYAMTIDHLLVTPPVYACTWLEPIALLSALAGVTRTIKLGTMVLVLPLRNPIHFAKEWATFDVLASGRSVLGVGVGWDHKEFELMQVPHNQRGARMDEMIELLLELWNRNDVTFRGRHFNVENVTVEPKPLQRPRPEIWMGGGTQSRDRPGVKSNVESVLRRIAKYADTWIPHASATADAARSDWDRLQKLATDYGRDPRAIGRVYSNFIWVLKKGEPFETAALHFSVFSGMSQDYWRSYYLIGTTDEIVDRICESVASPDNGVNAIILNPANWSLEQLDLIARDVLPKVTQAKG